jgi:hypothetical protein
MGQTDKQAGRQVERQAGRQTDMSSLDSTAQRRRSPLYTIYQTEKRLVATRIVVKKGSVCRATPCLFVCVN